MIYSVEWMNVGSVPHSYQISNVDIYVSRRETSSMNPYAKNRSLYFLYIYMYISISSSLMIKKSTFEICALSVAIAIHIPWHPRCRTHWFLKSWNYKVWDIDEKDVVLIHDCSGAEYLGNDSRFPFWTLLLLCGCECTAARLNQDGG